jgi:predicted solute-binding protein
MLHGPQRGVFDLQFAIPSQCADMLASGAVDIGLVPAFELTKQNLTVIRGCGIACRGPVRSILLVSKRPAAEIRTLAADTSSRSSVQLARVILQRKYGASPSLTPHPPDIEAMLRRADAGVVIGDPALRIDPERPVPGAKDVCYVYDLGGEWMHLTGLPMVFAVWAGRGDRVAAPEVAEAFQGSYRFGRERMADIIRCESAARGFAPAFCEDYLLHKLVHELGTEEYAGMDRFLAYAREAAAA